MGVGVGVGVGVATASSTSVTRLSGPPAEGDGAVMDALGRAEGFALGAGAGVADTVCVRLLSPAMAAELLASSRSRTVL